MSEEPERSGAEKCCYFRVRGFGFRVSVLAGLSVTRFSRAPAKDAALGFGSFQALPEGAASETRRNLRAAHTEAPQKQGDPN